MAANFQGINRGLSSVPAHSSTEMPSFWKKISSFFSEKSSPVFAPQLEAVFRKDFLRRIKPIERVRIAEKLKALPKASVEDINALKKGVWSSSIFRRKDWPYIALQAYVDEHLNEMEISKLYLYKRCQEVGKGCATHAATTSDGRSDKLGMEFLFAALGDTFTEEDKGKVVSRIHALPYEHTQYFSYEVSLLSPQALEKLKKREVHRVIDMANTAYHMMKVSLLILPNATQTAARVCIIPPLLWHEILQAKFASNAMQPIPVLGYSEKEKFSDSSRRVVGIPCSFVGTPSIIHHEIDVAKDAGLYLHDAGYHLFIESANPHRKAWIELALFLRNTGKQALAVSLLDRDCPLYAYPYLDENEIGRKLLSNHEKFWYSFPYLIRRAVVIGEEDRAEILRYILCHQMRWEEQYGISSEQLEEYCKMENENVGEFSLTPWLETYQNLVLHSEGIRWLFWLHFPEQIKDLIIQYS